jgi:protease I
MTPPPQHQLGGLSVAILVTDGFEQIEMTGPRDALEESGVIIHMLSDKKEPVQGYHHDLRGDLFDVDMTFENAMADEFDALLLPGGAVNSIHIRNNPDAQRLVRHIDQQGRPIGVICHAPWLLVSAGLVKGRKLTSWPSLKTDIENAGGLWADAEVIVDKNWVSSRKPDDIPAFNAAFKHLLAQRTRKNTYGTADDISSTAGEDG